MQKGNFVHATTSISKKKYPHNRAKDATLTHSTPHHPPPILPAGIATMAGVISQIFGLVANRNAIERIHIVNNFTTTVPTLRK